MASADAIAPSLHQRQCSDLARVALMGGNSTGGPEVSFVLVCVSAAAFVAYLPRREPREVAILCFVPREKSEAGSATESVELERDGAPPRAGRG